MEFPRGQFLLGVSCNISSLDQLVEAWAGGEFTSEKDPALLIRRKKALQSFASDRIAIVTLGLQKATLQQE